MKEILKNSFTKFLLKILSELNLIEMSSTKQFIYKEITIIQAYVSELLKALKSTIEVKSNETSSNYWKPKFLLNIK